MKPSSSIVAPVRLVSLHVKDSSGLYSRYLRMCISVACLILGLSLPGVAMPQGGTGRIEGTVKQSSGGPIRQAIVAVSGPTNRSDMSDEEGRYLIQGLTAGVYTVTVTRPGYVPGRQKGVEVKTDGTAQIPFTMISAPNETVVVTASRIDADLQSAPAAVSVVSAAQISAAPAANLGDLLRSVPGLNVVQTSAREFNLASRQASPTLTNSQIALVDGRTVFSDFYDIIFWDLIPVNANDIKQIEVVRGPVSAVWGPNAATGAVNIITKTPREAPGLRIALSGGGFSRNAGRSAGSSVGGFGGANITFAQAVSSRWSYRVSTGFSFSDAFPRPRGRVPIAKSPVDPSLVVGGGSFDELAYENPGTRQPKFDLRVDQEIGTSGRVTYEGGFAGSQGIIQTPPGESVGQLCRQGLLDGYSRCYLLWLY